MPLRVSAATFGLFEPETVKLMNGLSENENRLIREYLTHLAPGVKLHLIPELNNRPFISPEQFFDSIRNDVNTDRSAEVVAYLSKNQAALTQTLQSYQNYLRNLPPEQQKYLIGTFEQIKASLKAKRIPLPVPWRSITATTLFLTADDLAYSFFSSFIYAENEGAWLGLVTNVRKLLGLFTVCTLAYDLLTLKASIPAYVQQIIERYRSASAASEFIKVTKDVLLHKQMTKGQKVAAAMTEISLADTARILAKLVAENEEINHEQLAKSKWLQGISRYMRSRRIQKVLNSVAKNLSPIELQQLNNFMVKNEGSTLQFPIESKYAYVQDLLVQDFKQWMEVDPIARKEHLIAAYEEFANSTYKKYVNHRAPGPFLKLSMLGFSTFLTMGGLYAAFGQDPRMFDLPYYDYYRAHGWTMAISAGMIGNFFLGIQLVLNPFAKDHLRRPPPRFSPADWRLVRASIEIAAKELQVNDKNNYEKGAMPAKKFFEQSIEKYFGNIVYFKDYYRAGMCESLISGATRL